MNLPVFSNGTKACSNLPLSNSHPAFALNLFISRMLEPVSEPSQQKLFHLQFPLLKLLGLVEGRLFNVEYNIATMLPNVYYVILECKW